jgi:hypothetical protein
MADDTQSDIRAALSHLTPMKALNRPKTRVGGALDGGYVMLDDLGSGGICYSIGIGPDTSWDIDMAMRGWSVYQYDHTVEAAPAQHSNCHFHQIGIAPTDEAPNLKRLDTLVRMNGHAGEMDMVVKIDVEGSEWECLDCLGSSFFSQFRQIVAELHWMDHLILPEFRSRFNRVLNKLRRTHECVHIHANNFSKMTLTHGIPLAEVYEVSFARRADYILIENDELFPTNLDYPCNRAVPDYFLGLFKF